ncbi:hypothetical protein ACFQZQ_12030 [Lysobacter koreensis]|uniref:Secreted protein n=1 Tax=Lysobacter koreensis TaxID=266122 RepID=A0ABW2YNL2_9GAMM
MRARTIRPLLLAMSLALAPTAFAQQPGGQPIERQMTPEQFKAAGLDQLDAQQLANLNAWLNRTLVSETTKAAQTAKKQVEEENRGFLAFGSTEPIVGRIAGEFRGFGSGRSYTLDNGQVWQQVDSASLAGVRKTSPAVKITPSVIGNTWYLSIDGYNTRARVQRVK